MSAAIPAAGGLTLAYTIPNASQVVTSTPGGGDVQWLGSIGHVTDLQYGFVAPGGCDQLTCTLEVPATWRSSALNPGRTVSVIRGGHQVWAGKLDEPTPTAAGWTISAVGAGQLGSNFLAPYPYGTWPAGEPDVSINDAITRGLPWVNPGVGTPAGMWLGQPADPVSMTVTDLLNLVCTRGALLWYVNSQPGGMPGNSLSVAPLPTTVNRLLVCNSPVARTLGGDTNVVWVRFESAADNAATGAAASYWVTWARNGASVGTHGVMETYIDLSSAGVMSQPAATAVAANVLALYQRASFAGPFTVQPGQLLTTDGQPVDLGCEQAGTVCQLVLCDGSYGGEVSPAPVTFLTGAYSYNDQTETATITPYQSLQTNLTGMLSMQSTTMTPITVAS